VQSFIDGKFLRKDGYIVLRTAGGIPAQIWEFRRGLPLKWTGPSLAASQSAIATESLTIAHEGLTNVGQDLVQAGLNAVGAGDLLG
jgi:phage tail-like protein